MANNHASNTKHRRTTRPCHIVLAIAAAMSSFVMLLGVLQVKVWAAPEAVCHWTGPLDGTPRPWSSVAHWDCGAVPSAGDTAVIDGYGRVVDVDSPVTVDRLVLENQSTINGYHTLTVTSNMEWNGTIAGGGHLSPTGALETVVIAPGAALTMTQPGQDNRLLQGRLVNYGTVEHTAGKRVRLLYAVIDNRPGGVYHVSSGWIDKLNIYPSPDDGGSFINAGTLVKDETGLFTLHASLSNAGLVSVLSDTLRVELVASMQVVTHTGAFSIAAPSVLLLADYEHRFSPTSSVFGSGTFRIEGADALVFGDYNVTGLTDLAFVTNVYFDTPGGAVALPRLNMGGFTRLRGTNAITVTEYMTISASNAVVEGSSSNTNTLNIAPGARMQVNSWGGLSFRTLNNYGAVEIGSGQCFDMLNNAVFNNQPGGVLAVTRGQMYGCNGASGGSVNNYGRIIKLGPDTFEIYYTIGLTNNGVIDVLDGNFSARGPFRQTAGEILLNASTFSNDNYDLVFDGGVLRGSGTIDLFHNKWLRNNGATVQPNGLLMLDEHYAQGVSGTLQIDIGGLLPGSDFGVFEVAKQAALNGRLALSVTNGFLPASGDVFRVMGYGTHSGEFAQVDRGLGLAFGPEYQAGGVVVSDNPLLVEFSQRPDQRTMLPGSSSGFGLRLTNSHSETVSATLKNILPRGFTFLTGSATSNVPLPPPTVTSSGGQEELRWPTLDLTPGAIITVHFGVAITDTVGTYTNTAQVVVTPTLGSPRAIRLPERVDVSPSPTRNTEIAVTNALAYAPLEPDGLWQILLKRGDPSAAVSVVITSTPVCVLPACGPLNHFYALHDGQTFTLSLVAGTADRYRGEIPAGQFNINERIFLVPKFDPPTGRHSRQAAAALANPRCERVGGFGYAVYVVIDPDDGSLTPCRPETTERNFYDPSGNVTNARTGAPVPGATVTLYRVPAAWPDTRTAARDCRTVETRPGGITGTWNTLPPAPAGLGVMEDPRFAPAALSPAINPLVTDDDGHYGWDVIRGCWYVLVEAAGYLSATSPVVGVPPEVTDLHIALEPIISLLVTKEGNGNGLITSSPAGINCGSGCQATFDYGTVITLTAVADPDSTFTGWGGACSGTGDCVLTLTETLQISATFALASSFRSYLPVIHGGN